MTSSPDLKQKAIILRKQGLTYSEIRRLIPVAKSTLSDWLHSVGLAKYQKQILTEKKQLAQKRAAAAKEAQRITRTEVIRQTALNEISNLIKEPLWLTGTVLYWGEGSKQKPWTTSMGVRFMNMDLGAHKLFIKWSIKYLKTKKEDFRFEIYIHEKADIKKAKYYWSENLSIDPEEIRIYYKKHNLNPHRKNITQDYNGVLRTSIVKSTDLNRRIAGWTEGVIRYFA